MIMPIGSSSRTRGRLVMSEPVARYRTHYAKAKTMPIVASCNLASCNVLRGRAGLEGLFRHVHRRVLLTLRFRGREAGAGLSAATAGDLPAVVVRLQCLGRER